MRQAENVERAAVTFRSSRTKIDQLRLLGVQFQSVPRQPLPQHFQHAFRVRSALDAHDDVVSIADHERPAFQLGFDLLLEPRIQHFMQVDIAQQRRDHSALRRSLFRVAHLPCVPHARMQPLRYQASIDAVAHPLVEPLLQFLMRHCIKEPFDVGIYQPTTRPSASSASRSLPARSVLIAQAGTPLCQASCSSMPIGAHQ